MMPRTKGAITRNPEPAAQRTRLWEAMRNFGQRRETFTVSQLLLVVQDELGELTAHRSNAQRYLKRLVLFGYVECVRWLGPGREREFKLRRDTGPLPPIFRRNGDLCDLNTGETFTHAQGEREAA